MRGREIICYNCGEVTIDRTRNARGRFCSKKCCQQYSNRHKASKLNKNMLCLYNDYVVCGVHNCQSCGWNPTVETERKEALA